MVGKHPLIYAIEIQKTVGPYLLRICLIYGTNASVSRGSSRISLSSFQVVNLEQGVFAMWTTSLNGVRKLKLTAKETLIASCEVFNTVEPRFTDTGLIRTPRYYGQFSLSLGKKSPYILSKFNPHNTDT